MNSKTLKKLAFSSGRRSLGKNKSYYTVGIFSYNPTKAKCTTKIVDIKEEDIAKFMQNPNVLLANGFMKEGKIPIVRGYYTGGTENFLNKVAKSTRELMEHNYGTGTSLAGKGHEACSIMMAALNHLKIFGSEIVECYVIFPDGTYCKHHILKIERMYADITGDQFNRMLPKELQFKPVTIKRVLPNNIRILEK